MHLFDWVSTKTLTLKIFLIRTLENNKIPCIKITSLYCTRTVSEERVHVIYE
jgi:hypothetical protein